MKLIRKLGIAANVGIIGIIVWTYAFIFTGIQDIIGTRLFMTLVPFIRIVVASLFLGGIAGRYFIMGVILFCIFNIWVMAGKKGMGLTVLAITVNAFLLVCSLLRALYVDCFVDAFLPTVYFAINLAALELIRKELKEKKKVEALEAEKK